MEKLIELLRENNDKLSIDIFENAVNNHSPQSKDIILTLIKDNYIKINNNAIDYLLNSDDDKVFNFMLIMLLKTMLSLNDTKILWKKIDKLSNIQFKFVTVAHILNLNYDNYADDYNLEKLLEFDFYKFSALLANFISKRKISNKSIHEIFSRYINLIDIEFNHSTDGEFLSQALFPKLNEEQINILINKSILATYDITTLTNIAKFAQLTPLQSSKIHEFILSINQNDHEFIQCLIQNKYVESYHYDKAYDQTSRYKKLLIESNKLSILKLYDLIYKFITTHNQLLLSRIVACNENKLLKKSIDVLVDYAIINSYKGLIENVITHQTIYSEHIKKIIEFCVKHKNVQHYIILKLLKSE